MAKSGKKGRNKGGQQNEGQNKENKSEKEKPTVAETTRVRISKILNELLAGNDEAYTFEAGLSNVERAVVHELCRKMGMASRSSGRGNERRVTVYKKRKKNSNGVKGDEDLTYLTFSEETQLVLQGLFTRFPPEEGELSEEKIKNQDVKAHKIHWGKENSFCKPLKNKVEIAKKVNSLASRMEKDPHMRQIAEERSRLPIASFKDVITSTVESHQVPQFLLDYWWGKGESCKIVCTQPRRISAISVAERIACERGENVGDSVGYKIRLESKGGKNSSIMFCTNGVILRVLVGKGKGNGTDSSRKEASDDTLNDLLEITHIIVDEIHERDRFSDFMLAILRDILPLCPHLRVILMSATLDAERFSQYFGGCPIIRVPGFTYPVKVFYLEDVLSILKSAEDNHLDSALVSTELTEEERVTLDEAIDLAWESDEFDPLLELVSCEATPKIYNYQHSFTGVSPLMVFAGKGRVGDVFMLLSFGADCNLCAKDGTTALQWAERENQGEAAEIIKQHIDNALTQSAEEQQHIEKYLATIDPERIDFVLMEKLLRKICTDSKEGAVLVFLPGWDDINKTLERLLASPFFKDSSKFVIISLHSMVPSAEQKKVFRRPPAGCRKIILSTNISETAVTIDDVVYVIDSGRMKEKSYDPYNNVSTLHSAWVSKASAKQREGRAGRCQPGICYHLFSKTRAASLQDFQVPEIKRMPIEELCLQVKLIDPNCRIVDFLHKTLDPPILESIRNAIIVLQDIGALSQEEGLTELGEKLGSLPVHPTISRMLFFSIMMNCLDPALTLACASDLKDPFVLPMAPDEKKKAAAAKAELASVYGGHSDHFVVVAAFDCWKRAKEKGQEKKFCFQYFVSSSVMSMLSALRKQLQHELIRNGFIPEDISSCSLNARDPGILHAVLVAGLYPMVGRMLPPFVRGQRAMVETASGNKVRLHPHSSNFKLSLDKSDSRTLVIYDEITRGDGGMYIKSCTVVGPYPLLLLATDMVVAPSKQNDDEESDEDPDASSIDEDEMEMRTSSAEERRERIMSSPDNIVSVVVDRWLTFKATALDVAQIYCLRERLAAAMLFKVKHPREVLDPALGASVYAIACFLSYDGPSGISLPSESIESLTLMVNAARINKEAAGKEVQSHGQGGSKVMVPDGSSSFLRSLMSDDDVHLKTPSINHKPRRPIPNNTRQNEPPPPLLASVATMANHYIPPCYRHPRASVHNYVTARQNEPPPQPLTPIATDPYLTVTPAVNPHQVFPVGADPYLNAQSQAQVGYGSGRFGPYGRRGGSFKRKRGPKPQ
ncbi:DExH-box ATP-dependent RNA helicase DExH6-like isoform X2 [Telopea speciosissima]|uniref:DExH-box ATP-dependent RNA helicase DExH6-like isoform X2 n=1 Tax=Telopea speciosissima TaxID=54955 RepID=UPI001CC48ABB|nr:DExH-box ATP-dependent RNA helicase DExH6-like isoform X2 [Telopea speciosissima]